MLPRQYRRKSDATAGYLCTGCVRKRQRCGDGDGTGASPGGKDNDRRLRVRATVNGYGLAGVEP